MARVLLVDDEPTILHILATLLGKKGYDVVSVPDGEAARERLRAEEFDLMLSDLEMVPVDGMQLLKLVRKIRPNMPTIIMTGHATTGTVAQALKLGAFDYAAKPLKLDELFAAVRKALEHRENLAGQADPAQQTAPEHFLDELVAVGPAMQDTCELVRKVAPTDTDVLVWGEPGTGKRLVAQAIHRNSRRGDGPVLTLACTGRDAPAAAKTLFGEGPAPGDAGLLEQANGGTIVCAEIQELPPETQIELTRALQERAARRVGTTNERSIDVRLIATGSADPLVLLAEKILAEPLFHRLNAVPIAIEPLRRRRLDVLPLFYHLLRHEIPPDNTLPALAPDAKSIVEAYAWPGNVAELVDTVRYAVKGLEGDTITWQNLPLRMVTAKERKLALPKTAKPAEHRARLAKQYLESKRDEIL